MPRRSCPPLLGFQLSKAPFLKLVQNGGARNHRKARSACNGALDSFGIIHLDGTDAKFF